MRNPILAPVLFSMFYLNSSEDDLPQYEHMCVELPAGIDVKQLLTKLGGSLKKANDGLTTYDSLSDRVRGLVASKVFCKESEILQADQTYWLINGFKTYSQNDIVESIRQLGGNVYSVRSQKDHDFDGISSN